MSSIGIRISELQKRDPLEALAYMFVYAPNEQYPFDTNAPAAWRGFLAGIADRYGIGSVPRDSYQAQLASVEEMKAGFSRVIAEKAEAMNSLHREYEQLRDDCRTTAQGNANQFSRALEKIKELHAAALEGHSSTMQNLQEVFREKMTLRAPVDYWEDRRSHHQKRTKVLGGWTFGSMAILALMLGGVAWWVMGNLTADGKPELWRASVLVLVAVIGVWATRLIVRIFLSHSHLETDAAERVVMVKTYLALLESDKDLSPEDRKLVLAPLFRPASDGIVKDEGLPHPALDALTKLSGR
ncbi:DUF6161 domain-containing protein [Pandoraea pnomenusa]|uniref:DUF6161 domain-containing protein n=1 Tax=Pandoraea pnomenusa TaxID=93220 RepID=UPI00333E697D